MKTRIVEMWPDIGWSEFPVIHEPKEQKMSTDKMPDLKGPAIQTVRKMVYVPNREIPTFEKKIKERFPTITVTPGRQLLSRADEILAQYFHVELVGYDVYALNNYLKEVGI